MLIQVNSISIFTLAIPKFKWALFRLCNCLGQTYHAVTEAFFLLSLQHI